MEDILDEIEYQETFTDKEIFTQMWIRPRAVFRYIHRTQYDKHVIILLVLSGIASSLDQAMDKSLGDSMNMSSILVLSIIAGGLFGWISYYIYAALISVTGKVLKGEANTKSVIRVMAYAMTPSAISLFLVVLQILYLGDTLFQEDADLSDFDSFGTILFYGTIVIAVILAICTIVFTTIAISEVQSFGIGKAILNLVLPILAFVIPLMILFLLFDMF